MLKNLNKWKTSFLLGIPFSLFTVSYPLNAATLIVSDSVIGHTQNYIGTVEGGHFNINDLIDCGMNAIPLYCDMARTEWRDDDGIYGSPSIDSIKADSSSGFSNTIPWAFWDSTLTDSTYWWTGISFDELVAQCSANEIEVILGLRPVNPEGRPPWAPRSPYDALDWNEWWEYCFAVAYWCNVRHNYNISHFQVHNEPDLPSQGWDGTLDEYIELIRYCTDAIRFANSFSGTETFIHSPVVSNVSSQYLSYTIEHVDSFVDVVDYHEYSTNQIGAANTAYSTIINYDNDGIIEPLWVSEWGTFSESYNTLNMAIRMADNLFDFSMFDVSVGTHCLGTSQFLMWDWGMFDGLVNADSSRNEAYYAFRLCNRGMQGAKKILQIQYDGDGNIMATRDTNYIYITGLNINDSVHTDITQTGITEGFAYYYVYNENFKDSLMDTLIIENGNFSFFCPESALVCMVIKSEVGKKSISSPKLQNLKLEIFPNPFSSSTTISLSLSSAQVPSDREDIALHIYEVSGRLVKSFSLITNHLSLGTDFKSGIYFLRIENIDSKEVLSRKLIKIE